MSYCTQVDLVSQFSLVELIQLTDRTGTGMVDAAVLAVAINRADLTINRYLGGRALPVLPEEVVDLACDITRFFLYDVQPTPPVRQRYEDALVQLKFLATGKSALVDATGVTAVTSQDAMVQTDYCSSMREFI